MSQTSFEVSRPQINTNDSVICQTGGFDGPQEFDSGYVSVQTIPRASEKTPKSSTVDGGPAAEQTRALADLNAVGNLIAFSKEIDRATGDRFRDVLDKLEAPLFTYMQKSRRKYRPMALRLMVLGKAEADAKPWIVLLCHKDWVKRVQRFFDKVTRQRNMSASKFHYSVIRSRSF